MSKDMIRFIDACKEFKESGFPEYIRISELISFTLEVQRLVAAIKEDDAA